MAETFNFTPDLSIAVTVRLQLVSLYVNAGNQLIGVYSDGTELTLGDASDLPFPVTVDVTSANPTVYRATLIF